MWSTSVAGTGVVTGATAAVGVVVGVVVVVVVAVIGVDVPRISSGSGYSMPGVGSVDAFMSGNGSFTNPKGSSSYNPLAIVDTASFNNLFLVMLILNFITLSIN